MRLSSFFLLIVVLFSCDKDDNQPIVKESLHNGMLVLCEGLFQQNNSSLSWIDLGTGGVSLDFFTAQNGRFLGDTGNDMQHYGSKIYIIVNNSNTVEVINKHNGKSVKQISMNNGSIGKQPRSIAFYQGKAFVTCYDGFVDVIDTTSLTVTQRISVGANPEGIAVSMPLRRMGMSRRKSFMYGQASALVEPVAGVLGAVAVTFFTPLLPYALAFAAGAMIFVVVEEVIPETQQDNNTDIATLGFIGGFIVMMMLDVALG